MPASGQNGVSIRRGGVYLPADLAERHFAGIGAVTLRAAPGILHVLPIHRVETGGCLLKRINAAGDRLAVAPDLLAACGLDGFEREGIAAAWSEALQALVIPLAKD